MLLNSCRKLATDEVICPLHANSESYACRFVQNHMQQEITFRISPRPFALDPSTYAEIESLGSVLLKFYQGIQELYFASSAGRMPKWIQEYLELGKPELVLDYGRMRRFRRDYPFIIRPDILLTEDGIAITELDSVPGGFGLTAELSKVYSDLGYEVIGGPHGIIDGFAQAVRTQDPADDPVVAIVVSEESQDYFAEMKWLAHALTEGGLTAFAVHPEDLVFQEYGLYLASDQVLQRITLLYRFFELFDLKNIPKIDLILYAIRKRLVCVTPPLKSYLEEKLNFALFHHPSLVNWWKDHLGEPDYAKLSRILPRTWVVDNRPLPPHAVIPGLEVNGIPVTDFLQLSEASQSNREYVLKVSGFSENAWGSRGVFVGHDLSRLEWGERLSQALESFSTNPYILQEFRKARQVETAFYDEKLDEVRLMPGRVRLCPYYFVNGSKVNLAGILATICPIDKKLIHGMVDAVMVPTMVEGR